jgi:predicted phosphodiesterase
VKILVYSDLQADEGSTRLRGDPSQPVQRWRTRRFYHWATRLVRTSQVDAVWDLGDTTDNRTAIAHPTLDVVMRGCAELTRGLERSLCLKLIGNHEQHLKATRVHCGELFAPYFRVIPDREVVIVGDLSLVCTAFNTDTAGQARWLAETVAAQKAQGRRVVVLGHLQVKGCRLSSGLAGDGVPAEALAGADLVLLGHVHRRQPVGTNGFYVGSPFQQDFGEADDPVKAVAILDTDTLSLAWEHPPGFPRYRTISVDELTVAASGNDILSVILRTPQEAERFYALPAAAHADPVYAFDEAPVQEAATRSDVDLTFEALVRRKVELDPLPGVEADELVKAGLALR